MKQITKFKRLLSGVLSAVMAVSAVPIVSAHAEESTEPYPYTMFAASSDDGAITVNAGNFCVNGNVATNGTIVSSGNMNINGTRTEHANESMLYVLKKLNYSYFSGENVETYTENYVLEDLNININNPIDVDGTIELTGNINLNSGIKAVDDVTINGEVKNSNNAVICSETGDINIETSNVSFNGLIYAPYGDIVIDSDNLNLNNVVIIGQTITIDCPNVNANYSSSMAELIGNQSDVDVELYAMGSYNADVNAIDIEWFTNYTNSSYEVLYSDDNENYTSVATVTDATTYQYLITEDFQKRYFKISLVTNYGEVIESIPFVATKSEDGYEVDFLDSDDDGLPNIYEIMIGTDVNLPDTDSDTLTDYQEIYITGTDPTIYDSVVAGISDADADSDEDGLSNSVEITMGTNPQKADTDDDGLNDSEEGTYNTDPLNPDSDGDTLPDGDEPHIGLDPTNPETFDVPDAEYIVKQVITSDSDSLKKINTESSPYMLSIEIEAAGYVEGNLKANETSYSKAISNSAMLGVAPELKYSKSDTIQNVTLKFTIKPNYIENTLNAYPDEEELSGIKRLNVFKYFEDLNMLLPIETQFDVDNNLVYADVDELGTYCIMDIELWLNSFDIPEEEIAPKQKLMAKPKMTVNSSFTEEQSRMGANGEATDIDLPNTDDDSTDVLTNKRSVLKKAKAIPTVNVTPVDVAVLLQTSGQLENTFIAQKKMIVDDMNSLIKEYGSGNVRFCIITYDLTGAKILNFTNSDIWFTNSNAVNLALNAINYQYTSGYTDRGNAFKLLQENVTFRDNASKYIIQVMNGSTDVGSMYFDQINTCKKLNINYSEIMPAGYYYEYPSYGKQVSDAINSTNGLNITFDSESTDKVFNHICNHAAPPQVAYGVIIPTGWTKISLKGILDPDNGVKSDSDDLTDWEEVMTDMISWDNDGSVILPTVQDCIDSSDKGYALSGLERFKSAEYRSGMPSSDFEKRLHYVCNNTTILPIHSNPCDKDTDGDALLDHFDPLPFCVINNGKEIYELSEALYKNYEEYNYVNRMYNDPSVPHGYNPIEHYYEDRNVDVISAKKTYEYVCTIQKCLEHLHFLDMYEDGNKVDYGLFGGKTISAMQIFQINYGFEPIESHATNVDVYSYQTLLNVATNNGLILNNTISSDSFTQYNSENAIHDNDKYHKKFAENIRSIIPEISKEQADENITVTQITDQDYYDNIYTYNYSVPLDELIDQLSAEAHLWHSISTTGVSEYILFYSKVNHGKDWDVKVKSSWEKTIPNIKYYSQKFPFVFNDKVMNSENLGNFIYGCTGRACGFDMITLKIGSGYAGFTGNSPDDMTDIFFIQSGFDYFETVKSRNNW